MRRRRLSSLRRLRTLRERQRDRAAIDREASMRSLRQALEGLDGARDRYTDAKRAMTEQIAAARGIGELELLRRFLDDCRAEILASQHVATQAKLHVDVRSGELGQRERALRTCERLIEMAAAEFERERARQEQLEADDRASRQVMQKEQAR